MLLPWLLLVLLLAGPLLISPNLLAADVRTGPLPRTVAATARRSRCKLVDVKCRSGRRPDAVDTPHVAPLPAGHNFRRTSGALAGALPRLE